jgi:hypothetical protein
MASFMDLAEDSVYSVELSTITEWYLKDPLTAMYTPSLTRYANLGEPDIKVFEQRLALLWNTLLKVGFDHQSIIGGNLTQVPKFNTLLNTTSTTMFLSPAVYALDLPWVILYFVSVGVMFFAAVFSLITHYCCYAPLILGYVSSLIRDLKYFNNRKAKGNSAEDRTRKTKRLAYLKVMLADTKINKDAGKIAFVPATAKSRVRRRRWYE